ncbi:hypothetical protein B0H66DRAFT_472025 [Apodospora peruviana]|uniref:DUF1996 domain-containing protein n=1 Tax=Apodospora peruviana TaxID=516989 RepID=A0AAE0MBM5_9PEZI|nr:hypothetical protein B0H66DRAFT_472025 [Apodospora peruviana]
MKWFLLSLLAAVVHAGLRFGCETLTVQRLDPVVEPGNIPSAHLHQIVGGNAFNATVLPSVDVGERATCTTCLYSEDLSNYWTAVLYFRARNGTYKRVKQYANAPSLHDGQVAGMTIYYTQESFSSNGKQKITAFKPGFRMTVGSPTVDTRAGAESYKALRYTCLQTILTRGSETYELPKEPCPAGIMAIHHFPACWDGKNLDSPDHQSHMYNTVKGAFQPAGPCPASHPVRMPQVAYETMWNTTEFNDRDLWPEDGSQPFVWSTGDSVGYSTHADYLFGWKGDSLQRAMDSDCFFRDCGSPEKPNAVLKIQSAEEKSACKIARTVDEEIDGCKFPIRSAPLIRALT